MNPCSDCPFKKPFKENGSIEWIEDVMERHQKDQFFAHTCHKTDPKADGYIGRGKKRLCAGAVQIQMNDVDKTPGLGGVYESFKEACWEHLQIFLPDHLKRKS